jgi:hypothetical protein
MTGIAMDKSSEFDPNHLAIALDSQKSNLRSHSIPCVIAVLPDNPAFHFDSMISF